MNDYEFYEIWSRLHSSQKANFFNNLECKELEFVKFLIEKEQEYRKNKGVEK